MSTMILSRQNRIYVGREDEFGTPAATVRRLPAFQLRIAEERETGERRDKTGTRTFTGLSTGLRRRTSFEMQSYWSEWTDTANEPAQGALLSAALGAAGKRLAGGTVAGVPSANRIQWAAAHGLRVDDGVAWGGEMRFVKTVVDATTVELGAPFSMTPSVGSTLGLRYAYRPGAELGSVTVMDRWDPADAVQRVLGGAVVDELRITVNGDYHTLAVRGPAAGLLDSRTFIAGEWGLGAFPTEPSVAATNHNVIPGHLGQARVGAGGAPLLNVLNATVVVRNRALLRDREFGIMRATGVSGGQRDVRVDLTLSADNHADTLALYEAARRGTPTGVTLQLGNRPGQLLGIRLPHVVLESPGFDDDEARLEWTFRNCRAQGNGDDEIFFCLG